MSFVDTIVEQLGKSGFESIAKPQSFDLSDNTFEKMLEKQMAVQEKNSNENLLGEMGIPAGLIIEPYDANNQTDSFPAFKPTTPPDLSNFEIKDMKIENYLPDFMNDPSKKDSPLVNMAMKYAANMYSSQSKDFIDNISDLAEGLTGKL